MTEGNHQEEDNIMSALDGKKEEMQAVPAKYIPIIIACLDKIAGELARLYWNKNQKEIESPFLNTGASYKNSVFSVQAYSWQENDEDDDDPVNFRYRDLNVYWYKHSHRCVSAEKKEPLTLEFLVTMLEECIAAMGKDFEG